jgi:hypothetical protein
VHIDWPTLGGIAVVSAAAALTLVVLVACALVASSGHVDRQRAPGSHGVGEARTAAGTAVAALCLLAAGMVVAYALYLIVA